MYFFERLAKLMESNPNHRQDKHRASSYLTQRIDDLRNPEEINFEPCNTQSNCQKYCVLQNKLKISEVYDIMNNFSQ